MHLEQGAYTTAHPTGGRPSVRAPFGAVQAFRNKLAKGGHFAAWEQPHLVAEELRAAFRSLRSSWPAALLEDGLS